MVGFLEESSDPELRVAAADECPWNGRCRRTAHPAAHRAVDRSGLEVRFAAGRSLWTFGPAACEALPTFMEWLESETRRKCSLPPLGLRRLIEATVKRWSRCFWNLSPVWAVPFVPRGCSCWMRCLKAIRERSPRLRVYEEGGTHRRGSQWSVPWWQTRCSLTGRCPCSFGPCWTKILKWPPSRRTGSAGWGRLAAAGVPSLIQRLDAELMKGEPEEPARHRLVLILCIAAACIGPAAEPAIPYPVSSPHRGIPFLRTL